MRNTTKIVALGHAAPAFSKAQIQVYSPAGEGLLLFSVDTSSHLHLVRNARYSRVTQWDQGKIIRFVWTGDERLVVLNEEGVYRIYDLQGEYQQYSLGNEAGEMGIIDARIHETGLVALTGSLTFLEVKEWTGGKPLTLANPSAYHFTCYAYTIPYPSHLYPDYLRMYRFVTTSALMGCNTTRPNDFAACRSASLG